MKRTGLADLPAVEAAIAELNRELPVRASSLTLVTVGADGAGLAAAVTHRHPGRVLVLELHPGGPETFAAEIDADARFEVITLRVGGDLAAHPAALADPLLLRTLPVFLWWPGDWPPDDGLVEASDRLLCDSAAFARPEAAFRGLAALASAAEGGAAPGDLNWQRLLPWRQRTAQWFDQPDRLQALDGVRLRHAGNPAQAWLFYGWLRSCLGRDLPCEVDAAGGDGPGLVAVELAGLRLGDLPAAVPANLLAAELDAQRDAMYEAALAAAVARFCSG